MKLDLRREAVLIDARRIPAQLLSDVCLACDQARLARVTWSGARELALDDREPLLCVTSLPVGERKIPEALVELVTHDFPGLPLLLLCEEALVRRTISLQDGRVNLLGPPLSAATIGRRIAALLADRRIEAPRYETLPMGLQALSGPVSTSEQERTRWWSATVTCHGPTLKSGGPMPLLRDRAASGLSAVLLLPSGGAAPPRIGDMQQELDLLLASADPEGDDAHLEQRFARSFGTTIGLIHLRPSADEWIMYWPTLDAPLEIASPMRLPVRWDIARSLKQRGARLCRLRAQSGDLVVGTTAPVPCAAAEGHEASVTATNGGPAALRHIEGWLREAPMPFAGVLAEVL